MLLTFSNLAIAKLRLKNEGIQTRGFAKALREMADIPEELGEIGLIPDGWYQRPCHTNPEHWKTMVCLETEDTSPLTVEKLRRFADLWFACDSSCIELLLYVYDRYGENEREIDLQEYWGLLLRNDFHPDFREPDVAVA